MIAEVSRLSGFWGKVVIVAALVAAALAVSIPLLPRDEVEDKRRVAVTRYIAAVNTTQQSLILQLEGMNRVYRKLKLSADPPRGQLAQMEEAELTLGRLRARFARLRVPPEARTLHTKLLVLCDLQIAFAHEMSGIVRYLPLQAAEGRRLAAATQGLRPELEAAATGAAQRAVFEAFRTSARAAAERLEQSAVPPVLAPARRKEVGRLRRLSVLAGQIGSALERRRSAEVDRLFQLFARTSGSGGTTKAERQAVIAFNRRLARMREQRAVVDAERRRLGARLG